jgi:Tfp pilus assembly PilM family ATPase
MVQIVPAVKVVQLFVTTDDGTGEGKILYMRNVPGGCDALTPEFEAKFDAAFERFIESIRSAN